MGVKKADRIGQIVRWLQARHPTPYPVTVRVVRLPLEGRTYSFGDCVWRAKRFYIRVEARHPLAVQVDTLLHEWAHAVAHPFAALWSSTPDHGETWALAYGRIYRDFHDEGGAVASRER